MDKKKAITAIILFILTLSSGLFLIKYGIDKTEKIKIEYQENGFLLTTITDIISKNEASNSQKHQNRRRRAHIYPVHDKLVGTGY